MVDLSTNYLGLRLRTPLVASASPLSNTLDGIRRLEDAGASAVVMYSLFEEQIRHDNAELDARLTAGTESFAESVTYLPQPSEFNAGPEEYLRQIRQAKDAVKVPIIGSINGATVGGWIEYAKQIEQAGADAVECNIYKIASAPDMSSAQVEQVYIDIVKAIKAAVKIPVAIKVSPFFSNMSFMAKQLDEAGADGLTLFNRFYQPDINLEALEIEPNVLLSTPQALRLPLTWIGILYGRIKASLAGTSGVHAAEDAVKLIMVGADVTELCSTLLRNGVSHLRYIEQGLSDWMEKHEYESVRQMKGSMSQLRCADPAAFERVHYMRGISNVRHVMVTSHEAWRILTAQSE